MAYCCMGAKGGYEEAILRGSDHSTAFLYGITCGTIEALSEKYSIEALLDIDDVVDMRSAVIAMLKQGGIEASEEEVSFIASTIADALINWDKSAYKQNIDKYISMGYSLSDAEKMAGIALLKESAYTAITSFFSGAMGGAAQNLSQQTRYKGDSQAVIDRAMAAPEGSAARKSAEKYQQNINQKSQNQEKRKEKYEQRIAEERRLEEISGGDPEVIKNRWKEKRTPGLTKAQAAQLNKQSNKEEIRNRLEVTGAENVDEMTRILSGWANGDGIKKADAVKLAQNDRAWEVYQQLQNTEQPRWEYKTVAERKPQTKGAEKTQPAAEGDTKGPAAGKASAVSVKGNEEKLEGIKYEGNSLSIKTESGWHNEGEYTLPNEVQKLIDALEPYKKSASVMFKMYNDGQDPEAYAEAWSLAEEAPEGTHLASLRARRQGLLLG